MASAIEVIRRDRTRARSASGLVTKVRNDGSITAWTWRIWYSPHLTGQVTQRQGHIVLTGTIRESRRTFAIRWSSAAASVLLTATGVVSLAAGFDAAASVSDLAVAAAFGGLTFWNWRVQPASFNHKSERLLDAIRDLAPIERQRPGRRRTPA
ncbi:MAG: hypothetical protein J2P15_03475 [Micromonosporaceae bacterium]|nr:hypothetical protein [Micromonosporaceae bacterium]